MKDPIKVLTGAAAKRQGDDFENRVRADLEEKFWIVSKWPNNLFPLNGQPFSAGCKLKIAAAKHKMKNGRPLALGTGFPDFIAFQLNDLGYYEVIGVESKMNGKLSAIEKEKCRWYLKNNIFSKILIAEKTKEKGKIVFVYHDFEEKYGS